MWYLMNIIKISYNTIIIIIYIYTSIIIVAGAAASKHSSKSDFPLEPKVIAVVYYNIHTYYVIQDVVSNEYH